MTGDTEVNVAPFVLWGFCASVGWLIGDFRGEIIGVAIGLGISLAASFISDTKGNGK